MKFQIIGNNIGGGYSPTIRSSYFKVGLINMIGRKDGYQEPGVIEFYETNDIELEQGIDRKGESEAASV